MVGRVGLSLCAVAYYRSRCGGDLNERWRSRVSDVGRFARGRRSLAVDRQGWARRVQLWVMLSARNSTSNRALSVNGVHVPERRPSGFAVDEVKSQIRGRAGGGVSAAERQKKRQK